MPNVYRRALLCGRVPRRTHEREQACAQTLPEFRLSQAFEEGRIEGRREERRASATSPTTTVDPTVERSTMETSPKPDPHVAEPAQVPAFDPFLDQMQRRDALTAEREVEVEPSRVSIDVAAERDALISEAMTG